MATYFKQKKCNFTMIPNEVLRDNNLSRKAKGLYAEIYSYITIPNFKLSKSYLMKQGLEGETAFNSMWNELKEKGYLKQYRIRSANSDNGFIYEYDLLDKPDLEKPYLINIKIDGSQGAKNTLKNIENKGIPTEKNTENLGNDKNNTLDFVPPRFSTLYNSHMVQEGGYINNTNLNNTDLNNTYYCVVSKKESKNAECSNEPKNSRKTFNEIIDDYTENEELRKVLREHLKTRKLKRASLTNQAIILGLKKLDTLANTDEEKILIVQNSIMNGWTEFFALKKSEKRSKKSKQEPQSYSIEDFASYNIFESMEE